MSIKTRAICMALSLLAAGVMPPAHAASFDCGRAATAMEHMVCADPNLSALDERLAKAYAAALAHALDPAELRSEQRVWLARAQTSASAEQLTQAYTARIEALTTFNTSGEGTARLSIVAEREARKGCLSALVGSPDDKSCEVTRFAAVGGLADHDFFSATYTYHPPSGTVNDAVILGMRVVLFERASAGRLRVLFAPKNDGANFDAPKIVHTSGGELLHMPGYDSGTGNFNRERLFVWRADAWHDVDTTSWLATLQRQLPKGLGAWKGIYPDYATMRATTPLWRESDGNCCPTSGKQAAITLAWSGDRIVLASLRLERAKPDE